MNDVLETAGYGLDVTSGVWSRPDYEGIGYSDGDAVEERLAATVAGASDLSVLSDELRPLCTDWPSLYHLSAQRANLLRPFEPLLQGAAVLEVGAGCGAITRYLGECGARVVALEGSRRRAAIARSRTRDLDNVQVLAERFDACALPATFDVVTLIGVLEYASVFETGDDPWGAMLRRARAVLRPGGVLLLAIENQLGLKYFAGAPEDHRGRPMYGIEDQYRPGEARTFGRRALMALLETAGFTEQEYLSPLPDYKLPSSIVSEHGFSAPDFDVATLASQSVGRDPLLPPHLAAAPELVWPTVAANGLALELANSFLIAASPEPRITEEQVLAWHFATSRRRDYCKASKFVRTDAGALVVESRLLGTTPADADGPLRFHPPSLAPYQPGAPLSWQAIRIVTRDGWRVEELAAFFRAYLEALTALLAVSGSALDLRLGNALVPGRWFDALPQNLIVDTSGGHTPIDLEWTLDHDFPVGYLIFRSLLALSHEVTRFGDSDDPRTGTRLGLVEAVFESLGLAANKSALERHLALEQRVQQQVTCADSSRFSLDALAESQLSNDMASGSSSGGRGIVVSKGALIALLHHMGAGSDVLKRHLSNPSYLARNPDLLADDIDPYDHWLSQGYREGRVPSDDPLALLRDVFDERESTAAGLPRTLDALAPRLEALFAARDERITELTATIARATATVQGLSEALVARDAAAEALATVIAANATQIADRDARITELEGKAADLERHAADLEDRVASAVRASDERDTARGHHIVELEHAVWDRDVEIGRINSEAHGLRSDVARLTHELGAVYASTSWRMTAVIRASRRLIAEWLPPYRPGGQAFQAVRWMYRRLPLPPAVKRRSRSRWFGRLFQYDTEPASARNRAASGSTMAAVTGADGHREWESYHPFKHRLVAHARETQDQLVVEPAALITVNPADVRRVAQQLTFADVDQPRVSVVIPVYGGLPLTLECLTSLARARVQTTFEVIVADDASPDDTADVLALVSGLRLNINPENLGFLRNCNAAFLHARGEYIAILNSDVQVTDGWLDGLVRVFETQGDAGAAGPRIVYPSGHLQEAGVAFRPDGTADMVGLNHDPSLRSYAYTRPVDYCSGAALMVPSALLHELGGFSDEFAPAYCEDADLCLRIGARGLKTYYTPDSTVVHHLSKTMATVSPDWKVRQIARNLATFTQKWADTIDTLADVRVLAFYLPQFHAIPENNEWWGEGFTEWRNVRKAVPNFEGHYQPREPADLGYYDLNDAAVMERQAALARRYGIHGFCYYYYWFGGKRLLEMPLERMLETGRPAFPYCLCWANENWSRRWDGREQEVLMRQDHSPDDDRAVIRDISRHFASPHYLRIDGRPLVLVYRVELFPDFNETAARWREVCRSDGHGEIYLAYVESHDLVHRGAHPSTFGCDASVEFPPLNMAERTTPGGAMLNPDFEGAAGDYADTAFRYCTRELPGYPRFRGVMPGWDNTPRRQDHSFFFEHATPGVFQAWLETVIAQTRAHRQGDERIVFVNAWNEWAEGAYLEPDRRFGHTYLEAVRNARDAERLLRLGHYGLDL